tara:strand:+ start:13622 stop:14584 length:963 start_codon:yes stop_codon:yes gene_type:complete
MRILITGGFGFLGSRLAEHFIAQDHNVTLASRSFRKLTGNLSGVKFFKVNWGDKKNINEMVDSQDVVIHAAGINAKKCLDDPHKANSFNKNATEKLAKAAENSGVKNFFLLSTIHVYGNQLKGLITEESKTFNIHPYASSNLAGEKFINKIDSSSKMKAIVLRLANNFGYPAFPNNDCWSLVINDLCLQAIAKQEMVINGSGADFRDFFPIEILCNIFDDFLVNETSCFDRSIYNICSSKSVSIKGVAEKIQFLCQKEFNFKPSIIIKKSLDEELVPSFTIKSCLQNLSKYNFDKLFNEELLNLLKFCQLNKEYLNQSIS